MKGALSCEPQNYARSTLAPCFSTHRQILVRRLDRSYWSTLNNQSHGKNALTTPEIEPLHWVHYHKEAIHLSWIKLPVMTLTMGCRALYTEQTVSNVFPDRVRTSQQCTARTWDKVMGTNDSSRTWNSVLTLKSNSGLPAPTDPAFHPHPCNAVPDSGCPCGAPNVILDWLKSM